LQSISICRNLRKLREFSGVRPSRPQQHWPAVALGIVSKPVAGPLLLRPRTGALHLVAAPPRCAVSQVFNLPTAACEQRFADYKSAIGDTAD